MSIFTPDGGLHSRRAWAYGCLASLALLVVGVALPISLWAFRSQGDTTRQNNSADNRIQAQDTFTGLWADIQGYRGNILADAAALKLDPVDTYRRSDLGAEQQMCRTAVQEYNADAAETTMRDWRPARDPAQIDIQECDTPPSNSARA